MWGKEDLGILLVLSMKGAVGKRATFTFGDSTYCSTVAERKSAVVRAFDDPTWIELQTVLDDTESEEKRKKLEAQLSSTIFPGGEFRLEVVRDLQGGFTFNVIPSKETTVNNLLGVSVLSSAFTLNRALNTREIIHPTADYLEAQILGGLHGSDCDGILINESLKDYVQKLAHELPDFAKQFKQLEEARVIRYHTERLPL